MPAGILLGAGGAPPEWARGLPLQGLGQEDSGRIGPELQRAGWVAIDGAAMDPLAGTRAVRAADPAMQVVVVAPRSSHATIRRSILLAPGLGEVWLSDPAEVDVDLARRAAEVTRSRRGAAGHRQRLRHFFKSLEQVPATGHQRVSDAFLATILRLLPAPVVSLADDDAILSWNPAATLLFGRTREAVAAEGILSLAPEPQRKTLRQALEGARRETRREDVTLLGSGGEHSCVLLAAPVSAGRESARVLVIHDVTSERRYQERIEQQASELEMQAEELQIQTDELLEQRREIERVMELRTRFFATMSHELRTPINAILGYNDLALSGVYDGDAAALHGALERSQSAARHLVELVNDVLDLSKLEAGKLEITFEKAGIPSILKELAATVEPAALERSVELRLEPGDCGEVVTDPRRLRQILLNLISNAIRFGEGAPVSVRCSVEGEVLAMEVEDRGPGIAPEQIDSIFQEFVQLGGSRGEGTGLGLPISVRLAEALGGQVTVRSEVGRGSVFRVEVPTQPPDRGVDTGKPAPADRGEA
ncbi:MAG TPA: ATP-binding protein [Longimicrobiales bacterium]|nr:ATP-binding protein [Longimicrobiales bacterium]